MTKKIVMLVVLLFCSFVLVSCGDKITVETLQNLEFKDATIAYGTFIQNVIDFLIIAACIFCLIKFIEKFKKKEIKDKSQKDEQIILLEEIRDLLKENK